MIQCNRWRIKEPLTLGQRARRDLEKRRKARAQQQLSRRLNRKPK